MKKIRIVVIFVLFVTAFSCKNDKPSTVKEILQTISSENSIQKIEVKVEGMTCEIGCAKLIASKVSKLGGVTISKVNFEEKTGIFTFDASKISSEEIIKNINGIAGGDLYKVTDIKIFK